MPAAGAFSCRFCSPRSARCRSNERLLALAALVREVGFRRGVSDLIFSSSSLQPLLGVGERQLRLLVLDPRDGVALVDVELRALDVVLRLHQRGRVLLFGDAAPGPSPARSRRRPASAPTASPDRPLQRRAVELDDDVAGLDDRAVLRELDDLQLARLHRRRQHDRLQRPDVAADLERVDELALLHLGGRQIGRAAPPTPNEAPPTRTTTPDDRERDHGADGAAGAGPRRLQASSRPRAHVPGHDGAVVEAGRRPRLRGRSSRRP